MRSSPSVSVIIPTYNCARYIATAVESVLAQRLEDQEILVIDDGSTDTTRETLARFGEKIHYIYQTNSGVSLARNRGLAVASGRYVAFLDSDDAWYPNKIHRQLEALKQNPGAAACYSAFMVCDSTLSPVSVHTAEPRSSALEDMLLRGN